MRGILEKILYSLHILSTRTGIHLLIFQCRAKAFSWAVSFLTRVLSFPFCVYHAHYSLLTITSANSFKMERTLI